MPSYAMPRASGARSVVDFVDAFERARMTESQLALNAQTEQANAQSQQLNAMRIAEATRGIA